MLHVYHTTKPTTSRTSCSNNLQAAEALNSAIALKLCLSKACSDSWDLIVAKVDEISGHLFSKDSFNRFLLRSFFEFNHDKYSPRILYMETKSYRDDSYEQ